MKKEGHISAFFERSMRTLAEESEKADEETKKYYNAAITKIDTFLGSVARGYYHTWQSLSEFGYQAYYNGYAECLNSIISHLSSKLRNPKTLETAIGYLNARIAKFISEVSDKNSKNAKPLPRQAPLPFGQIGYFTPIQDLSNATGIPRKKIEEICTGSRYFVLGELILDERTLKWIKARINHMKPKSLGNIAKNLGYSEETTLAILQHLHGINRHENNDIVLMDSQKSNPKGVGNIPRYYPYLCED